MTSPFGAAAPSISRQPGGSFGRILFRSRKPRMSARTTSDWGLESPPKMSVDWVANVTLQPWSDAVLFVEGPLPARCVAGFTETTRIFVCSVASFTREPGFPKNWITRPMPFAYTSGKLFLSRASRFVAFDVNDRTWPVRSDHDGS